MADIEQRVDRLEEKVAKLELDINTSLGKIESDLTEIKTYVKSNSQNDELKNELIIKDVKSNSDRIGKLEGNQAKIVWAFVMAFLGLIGEAVIYYIQNKP